MFAAFLRIGQQLLYARVKRKQLHPIAYGGRQQPGIGDLPVAEDSPGASRPNFGKAEIERQQLQVVPGTGIACHGADARGNPVLAAPNLADTIWLYGGDVDALRVSIGAGRQGQMPAHEALLGKDRVRLMAAYVLSLQAPPSESGSNGSAGGG